MEHLTIDEILDFVSLTELNDESIKLAATVNGHIRECEKCLKLVDAFQLIYDEFERLNIKGNFKGFLSEDLLKEKKENNKLVEAVNVLKEMDALK